MLPKAIYKFNTIPSKIPMMYFTELEQIFQQTIWTHKRPHKAIAILRKRNKVGGIMLPNIKLYYKAIVIKQHGPGISRYLYQWNRIESPEINSHLHSQLILDRQNKHIQWAKDNLFNKWYWENWIYVCRKMKPDYPLTPHTRITSK